ncbi:hypothetical protein TIFTF001_010380 [Ficus carica]|uniref:DUF7356 domain-containing protein n=1 Tax=Ficus carica TaxID=3494 RepID=A0AA87ZY32_FICCA|nr:hypothetical protein TIFTF001_010380 [Ficus carica]
MDPNRTGSSLVFLFLVFFTVAHDCDASLLPKFRKLAIILRQNKNQLSGSLLSSPSPAPGPGTDDLSFGRCTSLSKTCQNETKIKITACLISSSDANKELFLLIQNNGESSIEVNVTTNKNTPKKIPLLDHQIIKVNVSDGTSSSIVLNAENGTCIIDHFESHITDKGFLNLFPSYVPLRNGAYLLVLSVLIFGACACCMLGKKGRHNDGVPYQELEMGHPESPRGDRVETAEPWDQGWDDGWDDIKEVRSPRARRNGNVSTNGIASRSKIRDD